jgi:hypothetical protein
MRRELPCSEECLSLLGMANDDFPLSIVIIYNDLNAAMRAAKALERFGTKFFGQLQQRLTPVPASQLADPARFDHLLADARAADMIIISYNGPGELPTTLKTWVARCLAQQGEGDSAVVALLSSNEQLDPPDSPRYQELLKTARAAGLEFFAPQPEEGEIDYTSQQLEVVS